MNNELTSRVVKKIVTKHPNIRSMVRNHPYAKVVGMAVVKCLEDRLGMESDSVSDELLEEMVEKGIELYCEKEEHLKRTPVVEQRRKLLCDHLHKIAMEHMAAAEG
ncbi:hypothetical protein NNO_1022 [Hydrogenimonas sp.]|nr:hypothetical protein NNO_1022 [Hydrogenimonas sp.]